MVEPFIALWVRELGPLPWLGTAGSPRVAIDRTTAVAFTILAVGQLLCTTTWGRLADRLGPARCLAMVTLALAVVVGCTSLVTGIEAYLGLRCVAAVFMASTMTLSYAAVARRVEPERKALAFGLVRSCMQIGLSMGPLLGSVVMRGTGLRGLFVVRGAFLGVSAAGMFAVRWARRRVV